MRARINIDFISFDIFDYMYKTLNKYYLEVSAFRASLYIE